MLHVLCTSLECMHAAAMHQGGLCAHGTIGQPFGCLNKRCNNMLFLCSAFFLHQDRGSVFWATWTAYTARTFVRLCLALPAIGFQVLWVELMCSSLTTLPSHTSYIYLYIYSMRMQLCEPLLNHPSPPTPDARAS